jgi:hypothetical protein
MRDGLSASARVLAGSLLIGVSTILHATPLLALAVLKLLVPVAAWRRSISRGLIVLAESWIAVNSASIRTLAATRIVVNDFSGLRRVL